MAASSMPSASSIFGNSSAPSDLGGPTYRDLRRYAEFTRDPLQLAWIGLELDQFIQLPPLPEPIAEQIDHLRDERI